MAYISTDRWKKTFLPKNKKNKSIKKIKISEKEKGKEIKYDTIIANNRFENIAVYKDTQQNKEKNK